MALPDFTADETFERDRRANDERLKSRFEHIFTKYERDFTGIGDEIDLTTGNIVVNNGHIASLHYLDIGSKAASTFIDSFAHEDADDSPDDGDEDEEQNDEAEEADDDDDDDDGAATDYPQTAREVELSFRQTASDRRVAVDDFSDSSDFSSSGALTDDEDGGDLEIPITPRLARAASQAPGSQTKVLQNISTMIRDSLMAVQTKSGPFDKDSLDRFENKIAGEIARFLSITQPDSQPLEHYPATDPKWSYPELPPRKRRRSESPTGLMSRPALSSSAAYFTKSPRTGAWETSDGIYASKRHRSTSPLDGDYADAQARFMSVVRAHASSHYALDTPQQIAAVANTGRRIAPKPLGGPSIEQQQIAFRERELAIYGPDIVNSRAWRRSRRWPWDEPIKPFKALAPKELAPLPPGEVGLTGDATQPYAGPIADPDAVRLLQERHVNRLNAKQQKELYGAQEDDDKEARTPAHYTYAEDAVLLKMRFSQELEWDYIAHRMPGRTITSLANRYYHLRRDILPDLMPQPTTKSSARQDESEVEAIHNPKSGILSQREQYLRGLFEIGKSGKTLLEEANLDELPIPKLQGDSHTGEPFSGKEDRLLFKLRDGNGMEFADMESYFDGRTAFELEDHYNDCLLKKTKPRSAQVESRMRNEAITRQRKQAILQARLAAENDPRRSTNSPTGGTTHYLPGQALVPTPVLRNAGDLERLIPRPSRFSGFGRNPFQRLIDKSPAVRSALSSKPAAEMASAIITSMTAAQRSQQSDTIGNTRLVRPPEASRARLPIHINNVSRTETTFSARQVHSHPPQNLDRQAIRLVSLADQGTDEIPNSTAQSVWTAPSQVSASGSVRLLQQRPLRPSAQRRRSDGDALVPSRGTTGLDRHASSQNIASDQPELGWDGICIEYESSPGPVDFADTSQPSNDTTTAATSVDSAPVRQSPPSRKPDPPPPSPPPQERLLNLTREMFRNHSKHVPRRRREPVWHSSDDEDGSDQPLARIVAERRASDKHLVERKAERTKYESTTAALKAFAQRRLAQTSKRSIPELRVSVPTDTNKKSAGESSSPRRSRPTWDPAKAIETIELPVQPQRAPSPDMPHDESLARSAPRIAELPVQPRRPPTPDMPHDKPPPISASKLAEPPGQARSKPVPDMLHNGQFSQTVLQTVESFRRPLSPDMPHDTQSSKSASRINSPLVSSAFGAAEPKQSRPIMPRRSLPIAIAVHDLSEDELA